MSRRWHTWLDAQGRLLGRIHLLDAGLVVAIVLMAPLVPRALRLVNPHEVNLEIHEVKPEVVWDSRMPVRISGEQFDSWCQVHFGAQAAHQVRLLNKQLLDVMLPDGLKSGVHDVRVTDRVGRVVLKQRALTMLEKPPEPGELRYKPAHQSLPVGPKPTTAKPPEVSAVRTPARRETAMRDRSLGTERSVNLSCFLMDVSVQEAERLKQISDAGRPPGQGLQSLRVFWSGFLGLRPQLQFEDVLSSTANSRPPCRWKRMQVQGEQWVLAELEIDASLMAPTLGRGPVQHAESLAIGVPFQLQLPDVVAAGVVLSDPVGLFKVASDYE